jgi:hypothetical protein
MAEAALLAGLPNASLANILRPWCSAGLLLLLLLLLLLQSLVGISSSFVTNAVQPGGELTRQLTGTETLKCAQQQQLQVTQAAARLFLANTAHRACSVTSKYPLSSMCHHRSPHVQHVNLPPFL